METLARLQLLQAPPKQPEPAYALNKCFREHVRQAVSSGVGQQLDDISPDVLRYAPSKEQTDAFASKQWEVSWKRGLGLCEDVIATAAAAAAAASSLPPHHPVPVLAQTLLLFAVGGGPCPESPIYLPGTTPLDVGALLLTAGLVQLEAPTQRASQSQSQASQQQQQQQQSITQQGFRFLLADTYSQLWQLLREYIARAERQSSAELASVLGFLLQLGFQGERHIPCASLSPLELDIAAQMAQLGVLLPFQAAGELWLRPSRLAVLLASGAGAGSPAARDDGFVVVETNYRVYAYTSSAVRQAILRLFVRCDVLLPNLFVGTITRDSAVTALESGVSAEQIVGYLRQHAHPRVAARVPIVPGVVADQIRLWQRELQRLSADQGVLYKNFEGADLYRKIAGFAEKVGACLVRDDAKREFVAAAGMHEQIKSEIKTVKKQLAYP